MSASEPKKIISENTLIPLGVAAVLFVTLLGGARWLDGQFNDLRTEIKELKLMYMNVAGNRWTAQDMEIYALQLERNNPNLKVPDISEIVARRQQNQALPNQIESRNK